MKLIITHINPDLDALASIWLIKKFLPGWQNAEVDFVPAGKTYQAKPADSNPDIIHVDTGLGKFDHHQDNTFTCSAIRVWQYIKDFFKNKKNSPITDNKKQTINRLVKIVNEIDHFGEVFWPDASSDRYDFIIERIFDGWKLKYPDQNQRLCQWGTDCLDGLYQILKAKIYAEEELKKAKEFDSPWGKAVAAETVNDEVIKLAQKTGFKLAIRKDPRKGYVRIKSLPSKDINLKPLYQALKQVDPTATWYLHPSNNMLLNGTAKNPQMKPTRLTLDEIIAIVKKINK